MRITSPAPKQRAGTTRQNIGNHLLMHWRMKMKISLRNEDFVRSLLCRWRLHKWERVPHGRPFRFICKYCSVRGTRLK